MKQTINFSISGEFITNFARDQWVSGNYKKSVDTLTTTLIGAMTEELALDIILGKNKLSGVNDLFLEDDTAIEHGGIKLSINKAWEANVAKIHDLWGWLEAYYSPSRSEIPNYVSRFIFIIKQINGEYKSLEYLTTISNYKISSLRFLEHWKPMIVEHHDYKEDLKEQEETEDLLEKYKDLNKANKERIQDLTGVKPNTQMLDNYLSSQREIDNMTSIEPTDTYDWDAMWISPKGLVFGMNGEIANMLHIAMAELIAPKLQVYKKKLHKEQEYSLLEELGYMKVSGDWVLLEVNNYDNDPTSEQIKQLFKITGNKLLMGLKFGFKHKFISRPIIEMNINNPSFFIEYLKW